MKSKQTMFFSTNNDIKPILLNIEDLFNIQYFKSGLIDSINIPNYNSFTFLPDLGYTNFGNWNAIPAYLIIPKSTQLNVRDIPQRKGGIKYAVDQMINPESIEFKPGGIYKEKDNFLVAGRIATKSEVNFSTEIYKIFSSKIKKNLIRLSNFMLEKKLKNYLDQDGA